MPLSWDVEADVVVVGFGAAGVAAAVTAHDLGAKVIILEKAPEGQHGGNTRVAGQGYLNTSSVEPAVAYLKALCGPFGVPEAMAQAWAQLRRQFPVRDLASHGKIAAGTLSSNQASLTRDDPDGHRPRPNHHARKPLHRS